MNPLDWLQQLPTHVLALSPVLIYVVCTALVFAEDAIFVGFAIPGETAAVIGGVSAALGHTSLALMIVLIVGAAITGDTVGYEIGKHLFGPKVLNGPLLGKHRARIAKAEDLLARRGGLAVFLGRFTAFFRAMMPALAGAARMPYPTFLKWNAIGGLIWGTGFVLLGHLAGASYETLQKQAGHEIALVLAVIVVAGLVIWQVRSHRREA